MSAIREQRLGLAVGLIALVVAVCGGAIAVGGVVNADGEIEACFDRKGRGQGDLRLLVKGRCSKGERPISWNQQGPRGPQGPPGSTGTNGADGSPGSTAAIDAFTKAESDSRYLRTAPREVVVRAAGTPAENGQALRDAIASLPAATQTDPVEVRLTAGTYAPGASPLTVPAAATMRGAGLSATLIDAQEPVVLGAGSALEDLAVLSTSGAGPAAVEAAGEGASVARVVAARQGLGVAEGLRVSSGASVTVQDSSLQAAGLGGVTDVRGAHVLGETRLVDTDVGAFSGFDELQGVFVAPGGALTMRGGEVSVDDNDTPGSTPEGLRLAGGASTIRDAEIEVFAGAPGAIAVDFETAGSALTDVSARATSSAADAALEASADATVEDSRLIAGDTGIQTFGAGTDVRVATSRIAAATTATGTGAEICVFSYGSAFTALSATCT